MQFKKIICFSVRDFNDNKAQGEYYPQEGFVINCFFHENMVTEYVAVGFTK